MSTKIVKKLGYSRQEVEDAIHSVKNEGGWRGFGNQRNPDIVVDPETGDVYPLTPGGSPAEDPIGNIKDYLEGDN